MLASRWSGDWARDAQGNGWENDQNQIELKAAQYR